MVLTLASALHFVGQACSSNVEPLPVPFEYVIPACEYFSPLLERETLRMRIAIDDVPGGVRRCSGDELEIDMRLSEFQHEASAIEHIRDDHKFWTSEEHGYSIALDGSREPSPVGSWNYYLYPDLYEGEALDQRVSVSLGYVHDCKDMHGEREWPGYVKLEIFRIGKYVGEYSLTNCIRRDQDFRSMWEDYVVLANRTDAIISFLDYESIILNFIAVDETAERIFEIEPIK